MLLLSSSNVWCWKNRIVSYGPKCSLWSFSEVTYTQFFVLCNELTQYRRGILEWFCSHYSCTIKLVNSGNCSKQNCCWQRSYKLCCKIGIVNLLQGSHTVAEIEDSISAKSFIHVISFWSIWYGITVLQLNSKLYLLASDQGYLNQPDLVWEELSSVCP